MDARPLCVSGGGACVGLRTDRAGRNGELAPSLSTPSSLDGVRLCCAFAAFGGVAMEYPGFSAKLAVLWLVGLLDLPYCCCVGWPYEAVCWWV